MKTFRNIGAGILSAVLAMTAFTGCQEYDAPVLDAPVATMQANTSIMELKKAFWDDATNYIWGTPQQEDATPSTIPAREDGTHYIIKGTVVSSDEAGNVFKSLIIQDETAALAISINSYNLDLKYRRGQEVVLDVTGMYIGKYNGLLQLGAPEWYANGNAWEASFMAPETFQAHVEVNGWPNLAEVDTLQVNAFSQLSTDPDGQMYWQSQLVRFNNVSFVNGGVEKFSEYHSSGVNQSITDSEGNSLIVRTSGYSNFWNQTLPEGNLDLVCIASYYGTTGWQLIMIDADGIMNVGNPTVSPGAESNPWSVNEAVTEIAAGRTPNGWVTGYIVGAVAPEVTDVTSNSDIEWTSTPILGNTIVIGQTPDTKDINNALVMELPAGSRLYSQANLIDNPDVYGKQIWIRATLGKYLGTYGLLGNNGTAGSYRIEGVEDNTGIANGDGTKDSPYSANQVIAMAKTDASLAWVTGYIVGSSNGVSASEFTPGAANASGTNIFIANNPDETDYTKCVPIQLPTGAVRTALNLASNPNLVGAKVSVYGTLEKYFGQSGVKNVTEYTLDSEGSGGGGTTPPSSTGEGTETSPYTCADVLALNPQSTSDPVKSGVWTMGYIVGWADMSSVYYINGETARFTAPATLATNILLADNPGEKDWTKCIGVQLPSGTVRNALNLQNNPQNLGKQVMIKGDIAKYSGVAGIRSASDYKMDGSGSGGDTPSTPGTATGLNENFSGGQIPAGWTQKQVAGSKTWYITSYSGTYYAAMTGYQGTAPFDSWLVTPGLDLSKMSDKVLTFDTEVNGYGSTTTVFEVYVMTTADPSTATRTKLSPSLPAAPASGYSSWTPSGNLDLSSYSGTIYIGFRYYATSDANYATWCLTNVKINAGNAGTTTPDNPSTGAGSESEPYSCSDVLAGTGSGTTAWVGGYIVGSSNGMSASDFVAGATDPSNTNIFIAASASETDYTKCVPVQLPNGDVRTALSLQQHPENLGKYVKVYGSLEKYFGQNGVKTVTKYDLSGSTSGGGGGDTPSTPSGDYKGDFNSFNGGTAKASPYGTYTNATGWTLNNGIVLGGTDGEDSNPYFSFIGGAGVLAPTLNGKVGSAGTLTSSTIAGGIGTLTFNYGFAFSESQCSFTINVKDTSGNVIKTDTVDMSSVAQKTAYNYSLAVNYTGSFVIEIVNNCKSAATGNKDRVSIWNLTWTN